MRDEELRARLLAYAEEGGEPRRVPPTPAQLRRRGYRALLRSATGTVLVIALAAGGTAVWAGLAGGLRDGGVIDHPGPVASTSPPPSATSTPPTSASAAAPTTPPPPADTPGRLSLGSRVTANGIGPVEVGMTVRQAELAGGVTLLRAADESFPRCWYAVPKGWPKVRDLDVTLDRVGFMITDGKIGRVDVWAGSTSTQAGIRIGSTERDVERAYPGRITASQDRFGTRLLTVTPADAAGAPGGPRRIVFETDGGRVTRFRAGELPEVGYDEGCA